jgi:TPR repeat protein
MSDHRAPGVPHEQRYQRAVDAGDTSAMVGLAGLLLGRGDDSGAAQLYQRAADAGDTSAMVGLAGLLLGRGDDSGAAQLYQRAADAGDTSAMVGLAGLLRGRGDESRAQQLIKDAADVGDTTASTGLEERPHFGRKASMVLATISDESVDGLDRLGIEADAHAMAGLVASKAVEPPLAIGLYGEWGSGKTFFMKRLEANIKQLTAAPSSESGSPFLSSVMSVPFSAWHYAEGNLWASLLDQIFSSLVPSPNRVESLLQDVLLKVDGARRVTEEAKDKVTLAAANLAAAVDERNRIQLEHETAVKKADQLTRADLREALKLTAEDADLKLKVEEAAKDLGIPAAVDTARDLAATAAEVLRLGSRVRVLATAGALWRSPLALALYAMVIVGAAGLLLGSVVQAASTWLGGALATFSQLLAVAAAAAAWMARQAILVRKFLAPAEQVRSNLDQRLADLRTTQQQELASMQLQIALMEAALKNASDGLAMSQRQMLEAKTEETELTGVKLMRRYLAERAGSGDYQQHLGVVALAHRDLKDLSEFLRAAINDASQTQDRLERIVLYIDDLDRCSPKTVADVLEAVHLLLALPLFVVIVGVDPRWLKTSLVERHSTLLGADNDSSVTPNDYLEKIFQLTYTLPQMTPAGCVDLLTAVARQTQPLLGASVEAARRSPLEPNQSPRHEDLTISTGTWSKSSSDETASSESLAEALTLSDEDYDMLEQVAPLVASTPRRAKRFLSVYLVCRARAATDPRVPANPTRNEHEALIVLVALLSGIPSTMATILANGQDARDDRDTVLKSLGTVLTTAAVACDPQERVRLRTFTSGSGGWRELTMVDLLQWLPIVKPYSTIALTAPAAEVSPGLDR